MSKINISLAEKYDAEILKTLSMSAFNSDFEKYGSYPPGIDSLGWHREQVDNGSYYKIIYNDEIVGGIYLIPKPNAEMKIAIFFIDPEFQNRKIGVSVMNLIEEKHKRIKKWSLETPYKEYRNHYFYEKFGYKKVGEFYPSENSDLKLFKYEKEIN